MAQCLKFRLEAASSREGGTASTELSSSSAAVAGSSSEETTKFISSSYSTNLREILPRSRYDLQPVVTLEYHHVASTENTGARVGAAPDMTADVLQGNLLDPFAAAAAAAVRIITIGCGGGGGSCGQLGVQDSIGRKHLQQILIAMIISTIRRRSAILSHVVRARVRTGTGRNGHRGAAAAASAATATGNRGRGLILLPLLHRRRRLPVVMVV